MHIVVWVQGASLAATALCTGFRLSLKFFSLLFCYAPHCFGLWQHVHTADALMVYGQLLHDKGTEGHNHLLPCPWFGVCVVVLLRGCFFHDMEPFFFDLHAHTGQFQEALDHYQRALAVHVHITNANASAGADAKSTGPGFRAANCIASIGDVLVASGRTEEAIGAYQCAEDVALRDLGPAHATVVFLGSKVAHTLFQLGHHDAATALYAGMLLRCQVDLPAPAKAVVKQAGSHAKAHPAVHHLLNRQPPRFTEFLPSDLDSGLDDEGGVGAGVGTNAGDADVTNAAAGGVAAPVAADERLARSRFAEPTAFEESFAMSKSLLLEVNAMEAHAADSSSSSGGGGGSNHSSSSSHASGVNELSQAGTTTTTMRPTVATINGNPRAQSPKHHSPHHRTVTTPPPSALRGGNGQHSPRSGASHVRFGGAGGAAGTARRLAWQEGAVGQPGASGRCTCV